MIQSPKILWGEGLFLRPQHFQQQDRHLERMLAGRVGPIQGFAWGFTSLEIDMIS